MLFIGTELSNLYTAVNTPAEGDLFRSKRDLFRGKRELLRSKRDLFRSKRDLLTTSRVINQAAYRAACLG